MAAKKYTHKPTGRTVAVKVDLATWPFKTVTAYDPDAVPFALEEIDPTKAMMVKVEDLTPAA